MEIHGLNHELSLRTTLHQNVQASKFDDHDRQGHSCFELGNGKVSYTPRAGKVSYPLKMIKDDAQILMTISDGYL